MSIDIIRGTSDKPATSRILTDLISDSEHKDLSGTLFIGYPIVRTPEGLQHIDALMVSPDRGVIVLDLVEGTDAHDYQSRQDNYANLIESRLKVHRNLMEGRKLRIPVHALTFAPAIERNNTSEDGYPLTNRDNAIRAILQLEWRTADMQVYQGTLSALQNVASIRKSRTKREIKNENSRGARLKKIEDSLATLDSTQNRAAIETVNGVQRIRGLAGSGKTIVLAYKAAYLHMQHPEWRIAVTFRTRSLKDHFRRLIRTFSINLMGEEPDWSKLRILNAWGASGNPERNGIYWEFCHAHDLEYLDFGSAKDRFAGNPFQGVCEHAMRQFEQTEEKRTPYDAILVDEAQDLPAAFLRICYECLAEPHRLVYAYDELQNLGSESVPSPEEIFGTCDDGTPKVGFDDGEHDGDSHDLILGKCYRNPRPVLVTAHALGFGIYRKPHDEDDPGLVQMFDNPELWTDVGYDPLDCELKEGNQVTLIRSSDTSPEFLEDHSDVDDLIQFVNLGNSEEQIDWVADAIHENLMNDELRHEDIIVINPDPFTTRVEVGPIRARLFELDVRTHVAGVDIPVDKYYCDYADSVTFSGVHRAKGNEAGMVYVINAQDCHGDKRNVASLRNRLFVAITRSKAWVRVVGHGERMKKLEAEYSRLKMKGFSLHFTYPTEQERKRMRIVHRDMTTDERKKTKKHKKALEDLIVDINAGHIHLEDLDESQVENLRNLLINHRR